MFMVVQNRFLAALLMLGAAVAFSSCKEDEPAPTPVPTPALTDEWDGSHTPWTRGAGTATDPYLIENAEQLAHLAYVVNNGIGADDEHIVGAGAHYKLIANIDLKGSETFQWTPIGYSAHIGDYSHFGGTFDGDGHTISNLYISGAYKNYVGLFGSTIGATIKGVGIEGNSVVEATISPSSPRVGGIVGQAIGTTITDCYNTGNISSYSSSTFSSSGGIAGFALRTTITNCYNTGSVSSSAGSHSRSGGIVGWAAEANTITNCYNTGDVSAEASYDFSFGGGIAGEARDATITNCYNTGNVFASCDYNSYSGGIAGCTGYTTIIDCYNIGSVFSSANSNSRSGGITGFTYGVTITNCYNIGNVSVANPPSSSSYYAGGIVGFKNIDADITVINSYFLDTCGGDAAFGGIAKTNAEMQDAAFAVTLGNAFRADVEPFENAGFPVLIKN